MSIITMVLQCMLKIVLPFLVVCGIAAIITDKVSKS